MQVKLQREQCQDILSLLGAIAKSADNDFIVLTAREGIATFHINSGFETLEVDLPAEVIEAGSTFIPLTKFSITVANASSEELTLSSYTSQGGGCGFRITGTNLISSWPVRYIEFIPDEWKPSRLEIPVSVEALRALISRVKPALIKDSSPQFQTIRLVFRPGGIWAVGASNQKIAGASYKDEKILNRTDALLPVQFLPSLDKVLSYLDGEINFGIDSSKISISSEGLRYSTAAAMEGPPNVVLLFKTDGLNSVEVDSAELLHAVNIASTGLKEATSYISVSFLRDGIKIKSTEDGSAASKVNAIEVNSSKELTQAFRIDFFISAIGKSKSIKIYFGNTEMDRAIFEFIGDKFETRFVLAPGRL